ncbi:MAG: hypothetical protein K2G23_10565, partial [Muribaculaceae bacterium]|nr:hypothetical protein [Muribaculaceae bacterium]
MKDHKSIANIESIELDTAIVEAIARLQNPDTSRFYDELLGICQDAILENPDITDDGTALDILRG